MSKWTIKKAGRNKDLTLVIIPFQITHFPFYTSRKKCLVFWCFQGVEKQNINLEWVHIEHIEQWT